MTDETLFAEALARTDLAARAAYLTAACPDVEQRARVEALLAAHAAAGGFLEAPAEAPTRTFDPLADGRTQPVAPRADVNDLLRLLAPPRQSGALGRIGHYDLLEVLGRGGFGVVFRARDEKLQRVVAVKVLAPIVAQTSPARQRFLREARAAARVRHENVVQVYEVGDEPLPYLVMEFVPGETLQQRIDRTGPLPAEEVVRFAEQMAAGLAAAHAAGVIHRDVKPANVLVEGGTLRTKLTDFGLARAADDASQTQSGTVAGTPVFMAPEQVRGERLDHRADLFSLGSTLYALLTGHAPFRAETTFAVLHRVTHDTPRPIRDVIPEVPAWLCAVVERLHAKDPSARYQSAGEVLAALQQQEPMRERPRRRARVLAVAACAVLAGVLLVARPWVAAPEPNPEVAGGPKGEPVPPPNPQKEVAPLPQPNGANLIDSRAYLPFPESVPRRVTDFAEIHATTPEGAIRWVETLAPGFTPVVLANHAGANPPQIHGLAVKLDGPAIESRVTYGVYAQRRKLELEMSKIGYDTLLLRYSERDGEVYDLTLWLRDRLGVFYWASTNRGVPAFLAEHRKGGKPVMLTPCHLPNPALTNVHVISSWGRTRWFAETDLTAEQVPGVGERARKADLFVYLLDAYLNERGETRFAAVAWENPAGLDWELRTDMTTAEYEAELTKQRARRLRPVTVTSYGDPKNPRYAAAWVRYAKQ